MDPNLNLLEKYKKSNYSPTYSPRKMDDTTNSNLRQPFIDTIHDGREKKWFFNTVQNDSDYFPFGGPGGGAPLRDVNNDIVSRLPHIEDNLYKQDNKDTNSSQNVVSEPIKQRKRDEIHSFIDNLSKSTNNLSTTPTSRNRNSNGKSDHYWNDWFGRPGAGAPNWDTRKQNLVRLLEPGEQMQMMYRQAQAQPIPQQYAKGGGYDPTVSLTTPRPRYRSDHHNRYEFVEL